MNRASTSMLVGATASVVGAASSVIATPIFVHLLGIEAFGLVGMFATLQVVLSLIELGAGAIFTREIARLMEADGAGPKSAALARPLEIVVFAVGALLGAGVWLAAPLMAATWVKASALPQADVIASFRFGALAAACQLPAVLYTSGLAGRQRLVVTACVSMAWSLLRSFGILGVLLATDGGIKLMFAAMSVLAFGQMGFLRWRFWREIGGRSTSSGEREAFRAFLRGMIGTSGVLVTGILLSQIDKLLVSALLPLREFGFYVLASTLAGGIALLVAPIANTAFPRLSRLALTPESAEFTEVYHAASQILSVMSLPLGAVLAIFAPEVLSVWSGNPEIVANSSGVLAVLALANGIGGCLGLLYYLELSQGRTWPAICSHSASLLVLLPVTIGLVRHFGPVGAAGAWLVHNFNMLLFRPYFSHSRLPARHLVAWYVEDVGMPLVAVGLVALALKWVVPMPEGRLPLLMMLGCVWATLLAVAVAACWRIRSHARLAYRQVAQVLASS